MATGLVPHVPAIPGIEHAERYADFATDPAGFRDQRVLIIGKGNSGFETADSLIPTAASQLVSDINADEMAEVVKRLNDGSREMFELRSGAEVSRFFDGMEMVESDVVPVDEWPTPHASAGQARQRTTPIYGAVGLKP